MPFGQCPLLAVHHRSVGCKGQPLVLKPRIFTIITELIPSVSLYKVRLYKLYFLGKNFSSLNNIYEFESQELRIGKKVIRKKSQRMFTPILSSDYAIRFFDTKLVPINDVSYKIVLLCGESRHSYHPICVYISTKLVNWSSRIVGWVLKLSVVLCVRVCVKQEERKREKARKRNCRQQRERPRRPFEEK